MGTDNNNSNLLDFMGYKRIAIELLVLEKKYKCMQINDYMLTSEEPDILLRF